MHFRPAGAVAAVLFGSLLSGADSRPNPLEAARQSRPPAVEIDEAPALERAASPWQGRPIFRPLGEGVSGWRLKLGGIVPGSGFALGPEFVRRDLVGGGLMIRGSARSSFTGARLFDAELAAVRLADGRGFLDLLATRRTLPRLRYYGPGPNSLRSNRTDYRLEDTSVEFTAGIRPAAHLRAGATAGYLDATAGPGQSSELPTAGGFVEFDSTDLPGSPRSGGDYSLKFTDYVGSHRRVEMRAQHYFPFFSRQRVIALRGYSVLTQASGAAGVPFYLQPSLGGPDTVRGFDAFRFHDNNLLLFNAEYRWTIASGIDVALFADSGKVAGRAGDLALRGLKTSCGAGVRFNARQNVFARVDVGCGREGCRIWLRFNNVF